MEVKWHRTVVIVTPGDEGDHCDVQASLVYTVTIRTAGEDHESELKLTNKIIILGCVVCVQMCLHDSKHCKEVRLHSQMLFLAP